MSDLRYGVFLRPDPATCWAVTQLTTALERQYGIVSAGAFPPHVTLVGNLATGAGRDALTAALDPVFATAGPVALDNAGPVRDATFHAHISLASHDLYTRGDLADEVEAFIGSVYRSLGAGAGT